MKFLYLVWRNLTRKKLRTSLTIASIVVAFLLYGILGAIKLALVGGVSLADANRLVVRNRITISQPLPVTYQARIARIPGVTEVTHQTWFGGIYVEPKNFFPNTAVMPEEFLAMNPEFLLPEEQKQAWLTTRTGAIVGRATAERFGWKVGDHIPLNSPIWPLKTGKGWEFDIVGIYDAAKKTTDTSSLYFRFDYFDEGRVYGQGVISWFQVRVADPQQAPQISEAIDAEFANSSAETKAEPEGAFYQSFAEQVGNIGAIVTGILSAVFFTILLVAANTMGQSVRERIEEIGVLKAMGFTSKLVLGVVLGESMLIALVGGVVGLGLALVLTAGGSPVPAMFPVFYIPGPHVAVGAILIFALGFVSGILPAMQAMRLRISDALRRGG
jgi:putative ABC transport system permease protein